MPSLGLTYLDAAVAPVSHDDIPIGVHSHTCGGIELPIALSVGTKLEEELSIGTVYLTGERAGDWGLSLRQGAGPQRRTGSHPRAKAPRSAATPQFFPGSCSCIHCLNISS